MLKKKGFAFLAIFGIAVLWSGAAFAQGGAQVGADNYFTMFSWFAAAAGFGIGIAAFGGALGQGKAAAAALEGIARNPGAAGKLLTPLILGLALIESLVIYAFVISFLVINNISLDLITAAG